MDEAEILRSVLDAAGIPVRIPDENMMRNGGWFFATILGGYRVLVPLAWIEQARELLDQPPISDEDLMKEAAAAIDGDIL